MPNPAQNGITATTWESMVLDAAVVYIDYGEAGEAILGATNGGVTFGWEEFNVRSPEVDGLKGRLKGVSRITKASPQITVNLVEWNRPALLRVFAGATVTEVAATGIATFTRSTRLIPDSAYPVNIAMVGIQSGTGRAVVIKLLNPLAVSGTEIPTSDESEATAAITFVGHYDVSDIDAEPWSIAFPYADPTSTSPAAFTAGQWALSDPGDDTALLVTVSALPANNGSAITSIEYRVDGGTPVASGISTATTFTIAGLTQDVIVGVQIRARNIVGAGPWSPTQAVAPTDGL